ncbi:ABC transporter ATP-binding protein [Botryobacter ruber]|uniref:ABC transporter ATP-binding protein n=1 Tax=Botryobacter ruber TaxID=2171629 RepID=UPI000E0B1D6B|nr:ABC transporter ATP-binding protein [Botryobacter ruber]
MSLLTVSGISVKENSKFALQDVTFSQEPFQKIAIAGETGSGKSTLLQTIAGLVEPTAGEVLFNNKKVIGPVEKLVPGHPDIAYLSQQFELAQFLRVEQVLRYANKQSAAEAQLLYEVCRITHLLERKTNQLSGGERQRIALARLLTSHPRLLLLDEPFSNLNITHKNTLKAVIRDISEKLGITCILVSHDPHDTLSWADEILVLQEGQVIQRGTPELVYRHPVNEYAASLFGNYNLLSAAATKAFAALPGISVPSTDKSMLIRPEAFKLLTAGQGIAGEVTQVNFFGSHYELEVQVPGSTVTVRTGDRNFAAGDTINLDLAAEDVWFV